MRKIAFLIASLFLASANADEPCKSGLATNQRPGPYTALVSVGPQRGQQHCFICESADRPVIIVFARGLGEPLGKLVGKLDRALAENKAAELCAWVTFLADDQTTFDSKVVQWSKRHATGGVPLGIFEDLTGPPAYRLSRDAEVTVLLSVKQKVIANFAYRTGELNDAAIADILKTVPRLVLEKK